MHKISKFVSDWDSRHKQIANEHRELVDEQRGYQAQIHAHESARLDGRIGFLKGAYLNVTQINPLRQKVKDIQEAFDQKIDDSISNLNLFYGKIARSVMEGLSSDHPLRQEYEFLDGSVDKVRAVARSVAKARESCSDASDMEGWDMMSDNSFISAVSHGETSDAMRLVSVVKRRLDKLEEHLKSHVELKLDENLSFNNDLDFTIDMLGGMDIMSFLNMASLDDMAENLNKIHEDLTLVGDNVEKKRGLVLDQAIKQSCDADPVTAKLMQSMLEEKAKLRSALTPAVPEYAPATI